MRITDSAQFGTIIRNARQAQKMRQIDLAAFSGCGERFIVELEKGKPTCELDKALRVAHMLGITVEVTSPPPINGGAG